MLKHENQKILLNTIPNRHLLIWGSSGYGKSYACFRLIEQEYYASRRTLVIDYSGSYSAQELEKGKLKVPHTNWNPYYAPFFWAITVESETEFITKIVDILLTVVEIRSYLQRKLLLEALSIHLCHSPKFNFSEFFNTLEKIHEQKKMSDSFSDEVSNIERLISRFYPYRDLYNVFLVPGNTSNKTWPGKLYILQLLNFPDTQRKFLTLLFSELLWLESKNRKSSRKFDTILFDEFQFLPVKTGSALALFLREGRKLGVGLILATQYISSYSQDEIEVLLQAGNLLVFHPNDRDLKFSAKILDYDKPNLWIPLLKKLRIGQAILKGNYSIRGHNQTLHNPIVCSITTEDGGEQNEQTGP